jgi:Cu(I)/Ag(I) efflux system membrane protein CusA/SilA
MRSHARRECRRGGEKTNRCKGSPAIGCRNHIDEDPQREIMIERIIEYSIRHPFIVIVTVLAVTAWGIYSIEHTPIDAIPDLSENQVIVFTDWMGRSPREIEDQITYPLSVNLQGLAGVKTVRSSSEFNFSMINIIFDDTVDFYFARTRVLERLTLASTFLPPGVIPYLAPDATALGQIFWYTVEGDGYDLGRLTAIQDWYVRYQLNSVPGVAQVSTVGGFPKEYQVDLDPDRLRAYNVSLGQVFSAIQNSNSAVGGRVIHKNMAEYLIRGVGWITSLDDIRNTVVTERNGTPIRVGDVSNVTVGPEFRRSVLEKDGKETVGAVVMMRYGENPLDVTKRIKDKLRELRKGLPEGVKIVPFYDRTRLIEGAIHTVTGTLIEELIIASIAILLILGHARSAFVVCITLPLAVLFSFIFMRLLGIQSNIMSLSGIAISIGVLVDQGVVMVENATHHLTRRFGRDPVTGDISEFIVKPCRQVGRPIFFSVLIMVISFLPVFALSGMEGKMFHPLAFTKTFALVGVALLSITLVPAIIPLLIKGKLSHEEDNFIVRSFIAIYRPVLNYLMNKPKLVLWLFVALVASGFFFWRHLGREFMPPLDEGSILDMPITVPRVSVTQVADDLKQRDAVIRQFPEVEMIVGKAGRADTPTDPSPLDMVESVINLRPASQWGKRKLEYDTALEETGRILDALEQNGAVSRKWKNGERADFINNVTMMTVTRFDTVMRREMLRRARDFEARLAVRMQDFVSDRVFAAVAAWNKPAPAGLQEHIKTAVRHDGFPVLPTIVDIEELVDRIVGELESGGYVSDRANALAPGRSAIGAWFADLMDTFGYEEGDFYEGTEKALLKFVKSEWVARFKSLNWEIFDVGMQAYIDAAISEIRKEGGSGEWWTEEKAPSADDVASLGRDFGNRAYLWRKTKKDLLQELDTEVRMLGWANIWTQPIINRVDMLATGVRTEVGVKVYGRSIDQIEAVSREVATALRGVRGAVDVVADQNVGKGYVEIVVDRERASRYGVNVADVQEIVEVALGGKPITTTVEGRERFPVRVRYARDFRVDEESIKRILVTPAGAGPMNANLVAGGGMGGGGGADSPGGGMEPGMQSGTAGQAATGGQMSMPSRQSPSGMGAAVLPMSSGGAGAASVPVSAGPVARASERPAVYLSDVADVKVVEGPVMIKSENGLLRSYVQLNVRDRDIVGFVEEAQRVVEEKVKLPEGSYLEWSGQFEHQVRARKTLQVVFPVVILIIFLILYITYNDGMDAVLMMMAVPGALAGGVLFQTLFGFNFSVAVWVGYIACFGMATETGIIMLVYLRGAIEDRGGLQGIHSLKELREAVVTGAVHRLRPKLLTEGTAILGLAPMLWATGVGGEVMRPMAAPVLGGLLVADEVIDVFLPVLFYHVRARRWKRLNGNGDGVLRANDGQTESGGPES